MNNTKYLDKLVAARFIGKYGQHHTLVVYFTKRDGSKRRMSIRLNEKSYMKDWSYLVWDLDKGSFRHVNVAKVRRVTGPNGLEVAA